MIFMLVWIQRSASGKSVMSLILNPSSPRKPAYDWLFSLQVAEVVCSVQVGGSGSHGTEDGNRARQDEVHKTALQVFLFQFAHHNQILEKY